MNQSSRQRACSQSSPHIALDGWTKEAVNSILSYTGRHSCKTQQATLRHQKPSKSIHSLITATSSYKVLICPNMDSPTSQFYPLCPSFWLEIPLPPPPVSAVILEVVIRLTCSLVWRVKAVGSVPAVRSRSSSADGPEGAVRHWAPLLPANWKEQRRYVTLAWQLKVSTGVSVLIMNNQPPPHFLLSASALVFYYFH